MTPYQRFRGHRLFRLNYGRWKTQLTLWLSAEAIWPYILLGSCLAILAAVLMIRLPITDFAQDYAAAWALRHGLNPNTPTGHLLSMCCPTLTVDNVRMQTAHPPAATLIFVPFALLPYSLAQWAWFMAGWAAVVTSWWSLRLSPLICFLTLPLWIGALNMGTLEPVLFLLLALTVQRTNQPFLAGLALGSAIAIKIYPALLLVAFLFGRRWRLLSWTLAVALTLSLVAEAITGATRGWLSYMPYNTAHWVDVSYNASLVRIARAVLPVGSPLLLGVGIAVLLILPLIPRLKTGDVRLLIPVMLLSSPLAWIPYMGLLALRPIGNWRGIGLWWAGSLLMVVGFSWLAADNLAPYVYGPLLVVVLAEWYVTVRGS